MVLGLFGGMIGIAATMFAVAGGLVALWGGAVALAASFVGIVGAALAVRKPAVAAALMLVAGIAGLGGSRQFFIVAGPIFLVGALSAFRGRSHEL
jgi:hypothetical protein